MAINPDQARRVNILLSEGLFEWAADTADRRGMSLSALIRDALEQERRRAREQELADAAEALSTMYNEKESLQDLRAIDGEEFA